MPETGEHEREAAELVARLVAAARSRQAWIADGKPLLLECRAAEGPRQLAILCALMRACCAARRECERILAERRSLSSDDAAARASFEFNAEVHAALRRKLAWTSAHFPTLIEWWRKGTEPGWRQADSRKVLHCFEKLHALDDPVVRAWANKVRELLGETPVLELVDGEPWSDALYEELQAMAKPARESWIALLLHASSADGSEPTRAWSARARTLIDGVGVEELVARLSAWFALVERPRAQSGASGRGETDAPDPLYLGDPGQSLLKGLCWLAGLLGDARLARVLGRLALCTYRKIPGIGPRAVKVGNAAVGALAAMPGPESLAQLAMLRVKWKTGNAAKSLEKALAAAARRAGLSRGDVEELAVPTCGFTGVGVRRETLGEYMAELTLDVAGRTTLTFTKPGGKTSKSAPAALKAAHERELAALKRAAKDAAAMLSAQRERMDGLFLEAKTWPFATWRERYLDHPVVGVLARALIWSVEQPGRKKCAVVHDPGGFVDAHARPVELVEDDASVSPWHPLEAQVDEVLAWRRFFEERGRRQPFKQAHREVYLLTDAERRTEIYSNRFAAHVLRQHQFHALCAARGWHNKLRLLVDDDYPPATRRLERHGLRVEFWIEGAGDQWGRDTSESGAFLHVTTDQVRFYPLDASENRAHAAGGGYATGRTEMPRNGTPANGPVALESIPPLVLSECLRDVDLFVGVASVGNDPHWQDGGPDNRYREYWWTYGFGELSEMGAARRELLERLVPRLAIAGACSFRDKFLVVRGKLRTYRIHLGSGSVLMEPNDQYLCLVPGTDDAGGALSHVHLPFEGDRALSIILSKAFLLAADERIQDQTILRQIRG